MAMTVVPVGYSASALVSGHALIVGSGITFLLGRPQHSHSHFHVRLPSCNTNRVTMVAQRYVWLTLPDGFCLESYKSAG